MRTLVYTSSLGLLSMLLEMLNLRRFVLPVCVYWPGGYFRT